MELTKKNCNWNERCVFWLPKQNVCSPGEQSCFGGFVHPWVIVALEEIFVVMCYVKFSDNPKILEQLSSERCVKACFLLKPN